MQTKNLSILEVREYNGRTILCQLRVQPRPVAALSKQPLSHRWLKNKHWTRFDDELERIIDSMFDHRRELESEQAFSIDPQIRVRLRRSCIPVEVLLRCVNDKQLGSDQRNIALAVECFIEHSDGKKWSGVHTNESVKSVFGCNETDSEYNPQQFCSPTDSDISSYVPYTPAKKNDSSSTSGEPMNSSECAIAQEDLYSPLPVLELSPGMPPQPYTPSPIRRNLRRAGKQEDIFNTSSETEIDTKSEAKYRPDKVEAQHELPKKNTKRRAVAKSDSVAINETGPNLEPYVLYNEASQSFSPLSAHDKADDSEHSQETESNFITHMQTKSRKKAIASDSAVNASKKLNYKRGTSPQAGVTSKEHILTSQQDEVNVGNSLGEAKFMRQTKEHSSRTKKVSDQEHKSTAQRMDLKMHKKHINNPKALDAEQSSGNENLTKQRHAQCSRSKSSLVDVGTVYELRSLTPPDYQQRRTVRSPKRLIDEVLSARKQPHKKVRSPAKFRKFSQKPSGMKDMFGSDTDGDDFAAQTTAPKPVYSKPSSSKNRKRKHTSDCAQEKQRIGQWLSKDVDLDTFKAKKAKSPKQAAKSKYASTVISSPEVEVALELPTKEERDERIRRDKVQIEKSMKLQEMLEELIESNKPKKVDILSLDDMSSIEILATFNQYKSILDDTFQKLRKQPNVAGHNGINHYSVMDLISANKQLEMMHKLGEVYEEDRRGTSLYTKLFANAMMPEWVVGIFKEKFQLTRAEAIKQLKAQRDYKYYLEVQDK